MPTFSDNAVSETYDSTYSWDLLKQIIDIPNRMAGQKGEASGANIITGTYQRSISKR